MNEIAHEAATDRAQPPAGDPIGLGGLAPAIAAAGSVPGPTSRLCFSPQVLPQHRRARAVKLSAAQRVIAAAGHDQRPDLRSAGEARS